jgi:hypothetical protein
MADDHSQRAYRHNEYAREATKTGQGNDPLAELARLIGQTDPFAEFGRRSPEGAGQQRAVHSQQQDWAPQPYATQEYNQAGGFSDHPQAQPEQAGYDQYPAGHDNADSYYQDDPYSEQGYDDVPPSRRRLSIMAIAAVAALAIVGTAGAVGYRALFGSSGASPPPVIKAETTPTKVVPPNKSDSQSNKLIYDRVGERSSGEKIVSREEQPLDINKAPQAAFPSAIGPGSPVVSTAGNAVPSMDQPKKIHTIAIRPDQPMGAPDTAAAPPARAVSAPPPMPRAAAPQRLASAPQVANADADAPTSAARPAPASQPTAPRNAPLSLSPNAAPPPAAAPVRTASVPPARNPAPAASAAGQYAVQISSQRSEAEAQAAFHALQGKYPAQLGNRQPIIRRADLGSKGVYYRALVGPFADGSDAVALCQSLKSAGGSCLIQKN